MFQTTPLRLFLASMLALVALAAAFFPEQAGAWIGRSAETPLERIELRVSPGGTLLGIAGILAFVTHPKEGALRFIAWVVLSMMTGWLLVRVLGVFVDGSPDWFQWSALAAEAVLVLGSAFWLRRDQRRSEANE